MEMNIVLLGCTGFVGSAVLRNALGSNIRVHALVRDTPRRRGTLPGSVRVLEGDMERLPRSLFPEEPHVVIHLATKQIDRDGTGFHAVNVEGTRRLMEALPDSTLGVLYGSSMSVYGQGEQVNIDETAPIRPETPLARSRRHAEEIILDTAAARGLSSYVLRPRFIFGLGDKHTFPGLVRMVRDGVRPGTGKQRYSIIGVDDYARVLLQLAGRILEGAPPEQTPLNLAYTRSVSMQEIVTLISERFGITPPRIGIPAPAWLTRTLRAMPIRTLQTLGTRLELFGLSHTANVDALSARIGGSIPAKDPINVLEAAAAAYSATLRHPLQAGVSST
jgi:Nucleoside-diphosphate-sugar epimerases